MPDQGHQRYRIADYAVPSPWPAARRPWRRAGRVVAGGACVLYAVAVLILWGGVRGASPGSWPVDLFCYGPRWAVAVPLIPLGVLAAGLRLRWPSAGLALAAVALPGLCGFNVPPPGMFAGGVEGASRLRVLTCNVREGALQTAALADYIRQTRPDVVLLQEATWLDPAEVLLDGWHFRRESELSLASPYPILGFEVLRSSDRERRPIAVAATLRGPSGDFRAVSVHLMSPRQGLEAVIASRLGGLEAFREVSAIQDADSAQLRSWLDAQTGPLIVGGDFNITSEHPLYRRDWSGFADAFAGTGWGFGHTLLTRRHGVRIDHILAGPGWRPLSCQVGPDVGSDHRPVVADWAWIGP